MIEGKQFFAIRGNMKSGTNWICRLLNLHPQISCQGEFHWERITSQLIRTYHQSRNLKNQEGLLDSTWACLDRFIKESMVLACDPDAIWIGDRTPSYIEPSIIIGARVFDLVRDGRDILVSSAYHFFNNPDVFPNFTSTDDLKERLDCFQTNPNFFLENPHELLASTELVRDISLHWANTVQTNRKTIRDHSEMVAMEIRYEDVHRDTESMRRKMYAFLDVDPEMAAPLAINTTPGFRKERPDQFLRKGAVGDWKNYITRTAKEVFNEVAGQTLIDTGYVDTMDWATVEPLPTMVSRTTDGSDGPENKLPAHLVHQPAEGGSPTGCDESDSNGYLEAINPEDDRLIVQGWMLLKDGAPDSIELVSVHGDVIPASSQQRPDLQQAFPQEPTAISAGYEAVVPRQTLRKDGRHEFDIVAKRGGREAFRCRVVQQNVVRFEGLTQGPYCTNEGELRI